MNRMHRARTATKPSLLVLAPRYPYPVVGGDRLRIYNVCRCLASDFDLTLLSLCESRAELEAPPPEDGVFSRVERVLLPRWRSILNTLLAIPTATPLQVAYYRSGEFRRAIDRLAPLHDACVAHLIRTGEYVRGTATPAILEMTDAISLNYMRAKSQRRAGAWKSLVYEFEHGRLLRYEKAILDDFEAVTLVSDVDRDFLLEGRPPASRNKVLVCSNGVDVALLPFQPDFRDPVIAFIGNMTTLQNMDACLYFIEEVMPLLLARRPIVFRIVGKIRDADMRRLRAYPAVEVTGTVANVAEAVSGARAGVCPIRIGAGVQNKILEYMALGLPVITSSIGLEGIAARPGSELFVADSPAEYVGLIDEVFDNPPRAMATALAARRYVERNHDWSELLAPLKDKLHSIVRN